MLRPLRGVVVAGSRSMLGDDRGFITDSTPDVQAFAAQAVRSLAPRSPAPVQTLPAMTTVGTAPNWKLLAGLAVAVLLLSRR